MTGDLIGLVRQGRQHLGELLVNLKKIDQAQLAAALNDQAKLNARLGEVLIQKGVLTQQELAYALAIQNSTDPEAPLLARKKLGDLLLETGKLTTAQLEAALQAQHLNAKKIGEVLVQMGFVTEREIDSALRMQDSLAYTSRKRILERLEARHASEHKVTRQTGPLPQELTSEFASRRQFLEVATLQAFQLAFGRRPTTRELAELRTRVTFVFGDPPQLAQPLPEGFDRAQALQRLSGYFQGQLADRIVQLAGADAAHKAVDRLGNIEVRGLSPRDLEVAIEVATAPDYRPRDAIDRFLERSPRAFFRASLGRDFASDAEQERFEALLDGPQAKAVREQILRLQGVLRDAFAAFPLARTDKAIAEALTLDEQELFEALKTMRDFGDREALRLFQEKEWWFRKLELARQTEAMLRAQLETMKLEQQGRKLVDLLTRLLGRIPPGLMRLVQQLMGMVGSQQVPNLAALEALVLELYERILTMFQRVLGRAPTPDELAQALEMAFSGLLEGAADPLGKLSDLLHAQKDGKSPQGGLSTDRAIGLVNQMLFEFQGMLGGSVEASNPWVTSLVGGDQTPQSMRASFEQYFKGERRGIGLPEALAFVEFLNRAYRGVSLEADPFDPYVQKLMNGELTPGEADREWKGLYAPPSH